MKTTKEQLFFLVAGEASGDLLGARLMRAIKEKKNWEKTNGEKTNGYVRFAGVGGPRMEAEGMVSLFPQSDLAHVGLVEVLKHIPSLLRRMRETVDAALLLQPDAVITIDSPDFCFRVARKIKKAAPKIPVIHYVAPSVWAWRAGRAKKIARFLDHLLALLPFEPPYFTREGLGCSFVGHPLIESGADKGDAMRFIRKYESGDAVLSEAATTHDEGAVAKAPRLALLLGSRRREIETLLPIFRDTVALLKKSYPSIRAVAPTVPSMKARVEEGLRDFPCPVVLVTTDEDKYDALAASQAALACSGTVSIELALARLPSVIAYKVSAISAFLARRLIRVKYVTLINIMENRAVMPEFLQENCTPEKLAAAVGLLLEETPARVQQKKDLETLAGWLGAGQFVPSERAADVVLDVVRQADHRNVIEKK